MQNNKSTENITNFKNIKNKTKNMIRKETNKTIKNDFNNNIGNNNKIWKSAKKYIYAPPNESKDTNKQTKGILLDLRSMLMLLYESIKC